RLGYAALAMRLGYPAEAKRVVEAGLAKKSFAGADLGEAAKLQASAARAAAVDRAQAAADEAAAQAAKDGNALVGQGLLCTVDGNPAQGAALLDQGIAKGGLKRPDDARLHLGIAQLRSGRAAAALETFQALTGADALGAQAHVWALLARSRMQAASAPPAAAD
ncbi:MAG: hypothetical protein ABW032_09900, partial [Burkholderiaceae bacterium]